MDSTDKLNYDELESQFHQVLGRFFVTFAGIELNLSLRVGEAGSFAEKLERFLESSDSLKSNRDTDYCEAVS